MSDALKGKILPLLLTLFFTIVMFAEFFIVAKPIADFANYLRSWSIIVVGFAMIAAYFTLMRYQVNAIIVRKKNYFLNLVVIVTSLVFITIGLVFGTVSPLYSALYTAIPGTINTVLWALGSFFLIFGIYKAFVVKRNIESVLFIAVTILLILYKAPIGPVIWPGFPVIGEWVITNIQRPAYRGLGIGSTLGAIVVSFRVLMGRERGHLKTLIGADSGE